MTDSSFELKPASPFRLDLTVWTLRRRSHNIVDRWDGATYRRVLNLLVGPAEVAVTQPNRNKSARLRVALAGPPVTAAVRAEVTAVLERLLGLRTDSTEFTQFAAHHRRLKPLADRFRGMRPPRFASVFESAINAIACQQVSLTAGIHLLNRLSMCYKKNAGRR